MYKNRKQNELNKKKYCSLKRKMQFPQHARNMVPAHVSLTVMALSSARQLQLLGLSETQFAVWNLFPAPQYKCFYTAQICYEEQT